MKIFNMKRGTGKTTLLIMISHFTKARIITPTKISAKYVKKLAERMDLTIPEPIDWLSYTYRGFYKGIKEEILIDELDIILKMLFGREIMAVTRTEKEDI